MTLAEIAPSPAKPASQRRARRAPASAVDPKAIEFRDVKTLVPWARNARKHPAAQIKQLAASIARWGFTLPLIVDGDSIVAGHGRLEAAISIWRDGGKIPQLATNLVPVINHKFLDDRERRAYAIADNKLAENALWDDDMLKLEFAELGGLGFDLSLTGFSMREVEFALAPNSDHSNRNRVSNAPPDPNFVAFEFGEYKGKVSRKLYQRFQSQIEGAKAAGTAYVMDDILKQWIGIQ